MVSEHASVSLEGTQRWVCEILETETRAITALGNASRSSESRVLVYALVSEGASALFLYTHSGSSHL